ncbi:hypothetical protein [Pedobacter caeni]|uniref:Uncharacterized protein n=1 Tax=Pedobacter caeni TaxID=288992 RepID=A0A1M5PY31_9SPHI|nr:hypothetical protein [Pedobacter caeni]SHH06173.1 hypothetical protein SAMN04488522_1116 [Pedobacter caeni]
MSKIACKCGHIIVDQTDDLPYKGYYIKDTHIEELYKGFDHIDQLIDAIKADKREEWIIQNFGNAAYALELSDSSLIHDLWLRNLKVSTIYTCENCERLLVQQGEENTYKTYIEEPED